MKEVTLTELRKDIFRLVDQVLETGEPIVIHRKGRRVVLRGDATDAPVEVPETEEERAERWRKFWAEPSEIKEDLTLEDIKAARATYWDEEPELDQ